MQRDSHNKERTLIRITFNLFSVAVKQFQDIPKIFHYWKTSTKTSVLLSFMLFEQSYRGVSPLLMHTNKRERRLSFGPRERTSTNPVPSA